MHLNGDILGPGHLQYAGGLVAFKGDLRVRGVVDDEKFVLLGKANYFLKELHCRGSTGRVVRVVHEDELRLAHRIVGNRRQVG